MRIPVVGLFAMLAALASAWPQAALALPKSVGARLAASLEPVGAGLRFRHPLTYPAARRALIRSGFDPVSIGHGRDGSFCDGAGKPVCRRYPELEDCAGDAPLCVFLFRRRSDGSYWFAGTTGEVETVADVAQITCRGLSRAESSIGNEVVLDRHGRRVRLPERPAPAARSTRQNGGRTPPSNC